MGHKIGKQSRGLSPEYTAWCHPWKWYTWPILPLMMCSIFQQGLQKQGETWADSVSVKSVVLYSTPGLLNPALLSLIQYKIHKCELRSCEICRFLKKIYLNYFHFCKLWWTLQRGEKQDITMASLKRVQIWMKIRLHYGKELPKWVFKIKAFG